MFVLVRRYYFCRMIIIGIAGGTGSGKTTVVTKIIDLLPKTEVSVISQDAYYKDNSHLPEDERAKINYDHPSSIEFDLMYEHIKALKEGQTVQEPIYSYVTHSRLSETKTVEPRKILIVEGILVFTNERLRNLFDMKMFVHADSDERLLRRLKRDILERGRSVQSVIEQYQTTLKPMHEAFIEPTKKYADLIVPVGGDNHVAIDVIASMIREKLG